MAKRRVRIKNGPHEGEVGLVTFVCGACGAHTIYLDDGQTVMKEFSDIEDVE